jgi:hypothetical protein
MVHSGNPVTTSQNNTRGVRALDLLNESLDGLQLLSSDLGVSPAQVVTGCSNLRTSHQIGYSSHLVVRESDRHWRCPYSDPIELVTRWGYNSRPVVTKTMLIVKANIKFVSGLEPFTQRSIDNKHLWCHSEGGPCSHGSFVEV